MAALIDAVRYCVGRGLAGAFAECGVWRGGSVLAMILTLQELDAADREIYLYDTFEGMTEPSDRDTSARDGAALDVWRRAERDGRRAWGEVFADELVGEQVVRETLLATRLRPRAAPPRRRPGRAHPARPRARAAGAASPRHRLV